MGVESDRERFANGDFKFFDDEPSPDEKQVQKDVSRLVPAPTSNPDDPLIWPLHRKALGLFALALSALVCAGAPTANQLAYVVQAEFYHKSPTEMAYGACASLAGFVAGPFAYPALFAIFGRVSVLFFGMLALLLCQVWAAEMTSPDDFAPFMVSRAIAGLMGSLPVIVGSTYIIDTCFLHQRGRLFALFELAFLFGVYVITTTGGFIVQDERLGWPFTFWWTCIFLGVCLILVFLFVEETNFDRSTATCVRPRGSYLSRRLTTVFLGWKVVPKTNMGGVVNRTIRSVQICFAPVTIAAGMYNLMAYGFAIMAQIFLNIIIQTPPRFGGYGFTPRRNAYFSFTSWVAVLVAWTVGYLMGDRIPLRAARRKGGIWHPEYRLWNLVLPAIVLPIGLGLYGAALEHHLHYMVLALAQFLIQFAAQLSIPVCVNYVTEAFVTSPAEVAIAMNAWRSVLGIALPFATEPWIEAVGPGWCFGTTAFMMVAAGLWMIVVAWKGRNLRSISAFKNVADAEDGAII